MWLVYSITVIIVNSRCNNYSVHLYITLGNILRIYAIYIAFINNVGSPNRFSFDGHLSTCKLLIWRMKINLLRKISAQDRLLWKFIVCLKIIKIKECWTKPCEKLYHRVCPPIKNCFVIVSTLECQR